ncbi:aminoacyl-tRNA deacylase [Endozoicomonas sp.]|uniref:aminoacyl-tRNA deacylase n=1 Tax=Endozoicomonas sp. TaxID=1892382 RepID=UPI003839F575
MTIPNTVHAFLREKGVPYQTVNHSPSKSSLQSAISAQVPLHKLAKAVILRDADKHYLMAIIPAANRVQIHQLNQVTNASFHLATEAEVYQQFQDCKPGAVPPIGQPYQMDMMWDDRLANSPDIYLEAGDHETLIHLLQENFQQLISGMPHHDLCSMPAKDQ